MEQATLLLFKELFTGLSTAYLKTQWGTQYEDHPTGKKCVSKQYWVDEAATQDVYHDHLLGKQAIGIGPVNEKNLCRFGVIDIDDYKWSDARLDNLCNQIEKFKLPLLPARSKSGGVRLYLFCEEMSGKRIRQYLKIVAALLGFVDAEIFPKTINIVADRNDKGNAITIPYFDSNKTTCYGFWYNKKLTLEEFLGLAKEKICKEAQLKEIPTLHMERSEEFNDGPPCLQTLAINGFSQGSRSNALLNIAVYLRLKHGDDGPSTHLSEYNERLISPPLEGKELAQVIKSSQKKKYYYMCSKEPICNFCNKDLCLERKYGVGNGASDELNITISAITKYLTDPPIWTIVINDFKIECETDDIIVIPRFEKLCIEKLHIIPNASRFRLRNMLQKALNKVEILDVPIDTTLKGRCLDYFERFLESRPLAKTRDELQYGYTFYFEGHVHFRSKDFMDYLAMEHAREFDSRRTYKILADYAKELESEEPFNPPLRITADKVVRVWRIKYPKPNFIYENKQEDF